MIHPDTFKHGMGLLMSHFDKQLDLTVLEIWKDELDQHLNDEDFLEAGRQLILYFEPRFRGHFPTAKQLLDAVNGSKEVKALQEWQLILKAASRSTSEEIAESLVYLSARSRVALEAIGGLRAVAVADDYRRSQLEKSFVMVFCQCADKDAKTLPPAKVQSTETEVIVEESVPPPEELRRYMEGLKSKMSMKRGVS